MIIEIALGIVLAVIILRMLPAIIVVAYYALGLLLTVAMLGVVWWLATDSDTYQPFWGMVGIVSFSAALLWSLEKTSSRWRPWIDRIEAAMGFGLGTATALIIVLSLIAVSLWAADAIINQAMRTFIAIMLGLAIVIVRAGRKRFKRAMTENEIRQI